MSQSNSKDILLQALRTLIVSFLKILGFLAAWAFRLYGSLCIKISEIIFNQIKK